MVEENGGERLGSAAAQQGETLTVAQALAVAQPSDLTQSQQPNHLKALYHNHSGA